MKRHAWVLFLLLAVSLPSQISGKDKGKILDPRALAKVESYCVDVRDLAEDEAYVVRGFLKEQSKPKRLLTKLRWNRVADCIESKPDARIEIKLPFFLPTMTAPYDPNNAKRDPREVLRAELKVYDTSTANVIYAAEALPLESAEPDPVMVGTNLYQRRLDALRRVFSMLISDLRH